jgi:putative nucleotidyltransferase with HDIG domain
MLTVEIDNKVKQVVSNIRNLPTPPIVFHQIQKVINDPNVSADHVASILSEDPAMSMKVLKLTNSAYYGLAREIESVRQAVVIVGMEAVKNLVLSASVLDMFRGDDLDQAYQDKFWRHSLAAAFCGRILAKNVKTKGIVDPDAAFSAGLLHDIGKMIMCCFLKDEFAEVSEAHQLDRESPSYEVERRVLGYCHAKIGAVLANQWKLPHKIAAAVTYHHEPEQSEDQDSIIYTVHTANYIAKKTFYDKDEQHLVGSLNDTVMEYLHISEMDIERFVEMLREEYLKAETFMQMAGLG